MKRKLFVLLLILTCSGFAFAAKKPAPYQDLTPSPGMPENIRILAQTSQAEQTVLTVIDLKNNEIVLVFLDLNHWSSTISHTRTGSFIDPNHPVVQGQSAPFVEDE